MAAQQPSVQFAPSRTQQKGAVPIRSGSPQDNPVFYDDDEPDPDGSQDQQGPPGPPLQNQNLSQSLGQSRRRDPSAAGTIDSRFSTMSTQSAFERFNPQLKLENTGSVGEFLFFVAFRLDSLRANDIFYSFTLRW